MKPIKMTNNTKPKISIIIPLYNVEQYIVKCLNSVVNQTITDGIECILVDDCGSDNSLSIARDWIKNYESNVKDKRLEVKIIERKNNGGLSAARNSGIAEARGDYLFFLDSDDFIMVDCIESMWKLAIKYNPDMVQGAYESSSPLLNEFYKPLNEYIDDRYTIKSLLLDYDRFPVMAQNRLIKRDLINDNKLYFKEGIIHEDNYWTFFLSKYVRSLAICKKKTYFYRDNPNGITRKINKEKEANAFKTCIRDFSANIDSFAPGLQKKIILYTLLVFLNNKYYTDYTERSELIKRFAEKNNFVERTLLKMYLKTSNIRVLHLLERIYKYRK